MISDFAINLLSMVSDNLKTGKQRSFKASMIRHIRQSELTGM